MRVALLSETFSKKMGYLQRSLSKHLAMLGVNMHVVSMDLFPYHQTPDFGQTYSEFNRQGELVAGTTEHFEGYALHVLGHRKVLGHMRMVRLQDKLREIRPDVVQTMANFGWIALDAAFMKTVLGYKLFTGNHFHASVFPLAGRNGDSRLDAETLRCLLTRTIPGWIVSLLSEKCYAITPDCASVAVRFFGAPESKVSVCPLGIDTEVFHPVRNASEIASRCSMRQRLGFSPDDIVCVYSGRFSADKNPLLLAQAITALARDGEKFRGLFIGNGVQAETIQQLPGNIVQPFVPVEELGEYFRASDIGVWPTQESMSMLDAAACGLPIVVNHTLDAPERIDGNGLRYRLNDLADIERVLRQLRDPNYRRQLGMIGAERMARQFGWENVAKRRLLDYEAALSGNHTLTREFVSKEKELA